VSDSDGRPFSAAERPTSSFPRFGGWHLFPPVPCRSYTGHMKISASEFKARCLRLLDQVSRTGEELVILKRGRPVARVVPAREDKPWLALRGRGAFVGDPFAPVIAAAEIEALR